LTEAKYQAERDWLEAMRKELRDAEDRSLWIRSSVCLLDARNAGDGVVRRELLATLFSDIHISQGRVVGYTPRADRQAQVTRLIHTISWNCPVRVGGDGSETHLTESLRVMMCYARIE
jgi:hypothetical protein